METRHYLRPVVTEASMASGQQALHFDVDLRATKTQVKMLLKKFLTLKL